MIHKTREIHGPEDRELAIAQILHLMEMSPTVSAKVSYGYEGGTGAVGSIPAWNSIPQPRDKIRGLIEGPTNIDGKKCIAIIFVMAVEDVRTWLAVLCVDIAPDGTCGEYIVVEDRTYHEAVEECTRYVWDNGGVSGYRLIPIELPQPFVYPGKEEKKF